MKHSAIYLFCLVSFAIVFASCSRSVSDFDSLLPDRTIAFARIENPESLISASQPLATKIAATKDKPDSGPDIQKELNLLLSQSSLGVTFDQLDLSKPAGIALYLPPDTLTDIKQIYLVALKKPDEIAARLKGMPFAEQIGMEATVARGYLIIHSLGKDAVFPPSASIQLPASFTHAASGVDMFVNVEGILKSFGAKWTLVKSYLTPQNLNLLLNSFRSQLAVDPALEQVGLSLVGPLVKAVDELSWINFHGDISAQGMPVSMKFRAKDGTDLAKASDAIGGGSNLGDLLKLFDKKSLLVAAWNFDSVPLLDALKALMAMTPNKTYSQEDVEAYIKLIKDTQLAFMDNSGAAAFDLKIDPSKIKSQKLSNLSGANSVSTFTELFDSALQIKGISLAQSKKPAEAAEAYKQMYANPVFLKLLNVDQMKAAGATFELSTADKVLGSRKGFTTNYKFGVVGMDSASSAMAEAVSSIISKKFGIQTMPGDKDLGTAIGDVSDTEFEQYLSRKPAANSLGDDASFKSWLATLPGNSQFVGSVSLDSFINLAIAGNSLAAAFGSGSAELVPSPSGDIRVYSYVSVGKGSYEAGTYLDSGSLEALATWIQGINQSGFINKLFPKTNDFYTFDENLYGIPEESFEGDTNG